MSWTDSCDCLTVIFGLLVLGLCWYILKRPKNFPPGPYGLPLVGYAPFLENNLADDFMKMKKKYGSVMSVQIGRKDWVILNDFDTINEAFLKQGEAFSGRPNNFFLKIIAQGRGVVARDYGPGVKILRKFGLMTLRGFGVGKKGMERNVVEETELLVESLTSKNNNNLHGKITLAVSNIICRIVFGSRFEYEDKKFHRMLEILAMFFANTSDAKMLALMSIAPILRFIPPFRGALKRAMDGVDELTGYIREIIEEHKSSFDENDIRDFIDAFLKEMRSRDKNDPNFNNIQLIQYIRDLFEAGTGTTTNTLRWAILCFANYPEYQEKIAKEIENVLGEGGIPSMKHRDDMPYTCAFIQELMRHRTLIPLSVFHKTNEDATLKGYNIPRNTTVCSNIWSVHFDPRHFENPREFRPERFLDRDGKFIKSNHVIPFSIGPRHCLGEQLARMEVFIFLTGIVQKLGVVRKPNETLPPFDVGVFKVITYKALDFEVNFEKR
uniref:cytochrome P450 2J3-like n=1 Tax=Styela clava TaxID=7725 RepID=UPI00193A8BD5|nr:cytochrome P450 2J3-like [Styela clava]